jgi:hypothetical protein
MSYCQCFAKILNKIFGDYPLHLVSIFAILNGGGIDSHLLKSGCKVLDFHNYILYTEYVLGTH